MAKTLHFLVKQLLLSRTLLFFLLKKKLIFIENLKKNSEKICK